MFARLFGFHSTYVSEHGLTNTVMSASEARIGDTIEGFYHDNSETATIASSYKRALEELDARTAKELDAPYRATVLDPISKMCSYFPEINKLIDKRGRKVCIPM